MSKYRILFLGQKPIGEKCFDYLMESQNKDFSVKVAVSNEDNTVWWRSNKIKRMSNEKGIDFISNHHMNVSKLIELIDKHHVNLIISVQHPWIIPEKILIKVDRAFNLHNAKLPRYKGHNACNHAILNGDKTYTCTLHKMVEEVDAGEIVYEKTFNIDRNETAKTLYEKAYVHSLELFKNLIIDLGKNKHITGRKIVGKGRFYKRNSIDGLKEIKNPYSCQEVDRKSRAFYFPFFEMAYIKVKGKKYYVIPNVPDINLDLP